MELIRKIKREKKNNTITRVKKRSIHLCLAFDLCITYQCVCVC